MGHLLIDGHNGLRRSEDPESRVDPFEVMRERALTEPPLPATLDGLAGRNIVRVMRDVKAIACA